MSALQIDRRTWLSLAAGLGLFGVAPSAFAGTYLDTATLFVGSNRKDAQMLRKKPSDRDLAVAIHAVAKARASAAAEMNVPEKVAKAHPHFLLTLAKVERAAFSASEGNVKSLFELLDSAKTEETLFLAALKELGYSLGEGA